MRALNNFLAAVAVRRDLDAYAIMRLSTHYTCDAVVAHARNHQNIGLERLHDLH